MDVNQIAALIIVIAAVVVVVVLIIVSLQHHNLKALAPIALKLVTEAEEKFEKEGEKTGTTKYGWVAKQLLSYIPTAIQPFIPATALELIIETAVEKLHESLEKAAES